MDIHAYWHAALDQNAAVMETFLHPDAVICWHCTNERFTAREFIRANCEYPGDWEGCIERIETIGELIVTAVRVWPKDSSASFHCVSFIRIQDEKIIAIDEYWADDGAPPLWRQEKQIGRPIRN